MADRTIHLVGTYPADNDAQAMREMVDLAGPYLRSLPSGETRRPNWIIEDLQLLEDNPDIEVIRKPGDDYGGYGRVPKFRARHGWRPATERIALTYHTYTQDNWPVFAQLRADAQLTGLAYQVGIPSPLETPVFAFAAAGLSGPARALASVNRIWAAYLAQIAAIWSDPQIGGADKSVDLVVQIEFPVAVGAIERAPAALRPVLSRALAGAITKRLALLPAGTRVILHPCNGDAEHKAFTKPEDTAPTVALLRAILARWPANLVLDTVHYPFASGDRLPATAAEFYRALAPLGRDLPENTRFAAGFVHEGQSLAEQQAVQDLIDDALGRCADVAYFCGFGRVPHAQIARDMLTRSTELAKR